jgi:hypothetical protein
MFGRVHVGRAAQDIVVVSTDERMLAVERHRPAEEVAREPVARNELLLLVKRAVRVREVVGGAARIVIGVSRDERVLPP